MLWNDVNRVKSAVRVVYQGVLAMQGFSVLKSNKLKVLPCLKPSLPCLLCGRANVSSEARINNNETIQFQSSNLNWTLYRAFRHVPIRTLRRGAGRRFRFSFDPRDWRFRRVGTVLRRLVSPRRRWSRGGRGGGSGGIIGGRRRIRANIVGRGGTTASHVAVTADLALKVQSHLHFHHFGRALD